MLAAEMDIVGDAPVASVTKVVVAEGGWQIPDVVTIGGGSGGTQQGGQWRLWSDGNKGGRWPNFCRLVFGYKWDVSHYLAGYTPCPEK